MLSDFQIIAKNANAPFTLKIHRGDGMTVLAMDWKDSKPPRDFVGFALEYKEPDGDRFWTIKNRINFPNPDGGVNKERTSTRLSPVQKFRWVHFPVNADKEGEFTYRVAMAKRRKLASSSPGKLTTENSTSLSLGALSPPKLSSIATSPPPTASTLSSLP